MPRIGYIGAKNTDCCGCWKQLLISRGFKKYIYVAAIHAVHLIIVSKNKLQRKRITQ